MSLEIKNPSLLARRLLEARQARGLTQVEAATHLGCSRPTFIAIEKGTRKPSSDEIIRLAALYGRAVNELVRPGGMTADLVPHFRAVAGKSDSDPKEFAEAILELQRFADDYSRLEEITGARLRLNYPPQIDISFGDVETFAQDTADAERRRLGLGDRPVLHLRDLLETEVGLRILYAPLPSKMAGMFAFVEGFGGIVAVNGKHPPERRRATLAHEYGHLIADRYKPGVDYVAPSKRGKPRSERFAEAFSMEFLMPVSSLRNRFRDIRRCQGDFKVADICRLSHQYFVSVEAMTIRLEQLGLIPAGTRNQLRTVDKTSVAFIAPRTPKNTTVIDSRLLEKSGFRVEKARRILGICRCEPDETRFSSRYVSLAVQAYLIGEISEEQLAGFLRCDRIEAREIVEAYSTSNEVSDDGEGLIASYDPEISVLSHGRK